MIADMTLTARWTGDRAFLIKSLSPTVAAVLGNVFIGPLACFGWL